MTWTAALGRAVDRFTPWARDIERAEVLRDAGPDIPWAELDRIQGRRPRRPDLLAQAERAAGQEPVAAEPELSDAEIERICEQEEQRIADYWGGTGPDWEAACARSLVGNEAAEAERAGMHGNWDEVMRVREDAEWGRDVLAEMDLEAEQ